MKVIQSKREVLQVQSYEVKSVVKLKQWRNCFLLVFQGWNYFFEFYTNQNFPI